MVAHKNKPKSKINKQREIEQRKRKNRKNSINNIISNSDINMFRSIFTNITNL